MGIDARSGMHCVRCCSERCGHSRFVCKTCIWWCEAGDGVQSERGCVALSAERIVGQNAVHCGWWIYWNANRYCEREERR